MAERFVPIVETRLNRKIDKTIPIAGGMNNQLFRLKIDNHPDLLTKVYYQDDRNRLDREYSALDFFNRNGSTSVPTPYFREGNDFAVYSFEESVDKPPQDIANEDIAKMVDFVCYMHTFTPSQTPDKFDNAVMPVFSFEQFLGGAKFRINKYLDFMGQGDIDPEIKNFDNSYDIKGLVEQTEDKVMKMSGTKFGEILDVEQRRLSPADFGIHNMLFRPDGNICFIDFEYFGWDDPTRLISSFYAHDANSGMGQDKRQYFVDRYKSNSPLSQDILGRIDVSMLLSSAEWIGTILWGLTPEKTEARKFSDPQFNMQVYLERQIPKLAQRIDDLNEKLRVS
jgi:thiamine kinase-like enzyme